LIALKAGNSIVLSPHPRANACTCESAEILHRAAVEGGAPEGIVQCIGGSTLEGTHALIRHERTAVILATGGAAMVRAAYSSGKPSFGVGPGNVPVLIERSADLADAVAKVVAGKSFDYGTVCSSEQAIVAEESLRERIGSELRANRAYFCTPEQRDALGKLLVLPNFNINPVCVGQAPTKIAQMAGFSVPPETSIIVAELEGVGKQHPLSVEKLSPVLALYFTPDFARSLDMCEALLKFGGMGHTCVIYSKDESRIRDFAARMPAMRVLVNTPAPQGSTGITTNVFPSMTLGCGAAAGNSTGDNIGPLHLINVKRLAYAVRRPEEAFTVPLDGSAAAVLPSAGRPAISAAVERYLSRRGFGKAEEQPQTSGSSAVPKQPGAGASSLAADVVDRFLARRGGGAVENPPKPAPGKG
jgi:acetaldehyde dehydrogenase (acetylating)